MDHRTELLTIGETATELRLGRSFVYRELIGTGQLPVVHIGARAVRVRRVDLLAWIEGRSAAEMKTPQPTPTSAFAEDGGGSRDPRAER